MLGAAMETEAVETEMEMEATGMVETVETAEAGIKPTTEVWC